MSIATGLTHLLFRSRGLLRLGILGLALSAGLWASQVVGPSTRGEVSSPSLALSLELTLRDAVQRQLSRHLADPSVALIDIDEQSLAALGPWPWPRSRLAELVEASLADGQARIVVMDIVLPESKDPEGDARLAALAQGRRLVLAEVLDYAPRQPPLRLGTLAPVSPAPIAQAHWPEASGFMANHIGLSLTAPCAGNIGFIPDPDGRLRRLPLWTQWQNTARPTLALATLRCLDEKNWVQDSKERPEPRQLPLRFRISDESWPVIPAKVLLQDPTQAAQVLQGRIALIGSSALGLTDRASTPLSAMVSGMTIHAQLIEELRARPSWALSAPVALSLQMLLATVLAWALIRARTASQLALVCVGLTAAWTALLGIGVSLASVTPLTAGLWSVGVLVLVLAPTEWLADRARANTISRILSRYVTPPILKAIISESTQDPLRPRSARITVLTLDMVNYSSHTASLTLDSAARLTRQFLTAMTGPIWAEEGTLDRYTGDGLVAFWGAPLAQPDQVQRAARAAQGLYRALRPLNQRLREQGIAPVQIRIGVACGEALVGDMGTDQRAHYTAVGACINLAARLEALGKEIGEASLVSQEVAQSLDAEDTESLGLHSIKGFGSTPVYRLVISEGS